MNINFLSSLFPPSPSLLLFHPLPFLLILFILFILLEGRQCQGGDK